MAVANHALSTIEYSDIGWGKGTQFAVAWSRLCGGSSRVWGLRHGGGVLWFGVAQLGRRIIVLAYGRWMHLQDV